MKFSVIYSFDVPRDISVNYMYPQRYIRRKMDITEMDDQGDMESDDGTRWKHRKLAGVLSQDDFDEFVRDCDLIAEDIETGGMLGAPGFGYGWTPAVSFNAESDAGYANAYVCPITENEEEEALFGDDWEKVRKYIIDKYR